MLLSTGPLTKQSVSISMYISFKLIYAQFTKDFYRSTFYFSKWTDLNTTEIITQPKHIVIFQKYDLEVDLFKNSWQNISLGRPFSFSKLGYILYLSSPILNLSSIYTWTFYKPFCFFYLFFIDMSQTFGLSNYL